MPHKTDRYREGMTRARIKMLGVSREPLHDSNGLPDDMKLTIKWLAVSDRNATGRDRTHCRTRVVAW